MDCNYVIAFSRQNDWTSKCHYQALGVTATLVCFVFIVTSPILVSHALASVVAYLIAHTNFGSAQNGVFAVSRIRERIRFGCAVNRSSNRYILGCIEKTFFSQKFSQHLEKYVDWCKNTWVKI